MEVSITSLEVIVKQGPFGVWLALKILISTERTAVFRAATSLKMDLVIQFLGL